MSEGAQPRLPGRGARLFLEGLRALVVLLFLAGVSLPFLRDSDPWETSCPPSPRRGAEWINRGILESSSRLAHGVIHKGRGSLQRELSWIFATLALLGLPVAIAFQKRPARAFLLAGAGWIGVVWMFVLAIPEPNPFYIGPGFLAWHSGAVLGFGIASWSLLMSQLGDRRASPVAESSKRRGSASA